MANIVVTTVGNNVVMVSTDGRDSQKWSVCHTATTGYMIIDTIDGAAPTSQNDLISKLTAIM